VILAAGSASGAKWGRKWDIEAVGCEEWLTGSVDDLRASGCREVEAAVVAGLLLQAIFNVPATVRPTAIMTNRLFDFALNPDVGQGFIVREKWDFPSAHRAPTSGAADPRRYPMNSTVQNEH
jgi:hypothetical protein